MKIAVLGLGMWGFCIARHLALQGHQVFGWTKEENIMTILRRGDDHPHLHRSCRGLSLNIVSSIGEAIHDVDLIVESVTTGGLRSVLNEIHRTEKTLPAPFVLTSKGIEQNTFLTPPDIVVDVFSPACQSIVCMLSGPSFAVEVASHLPTAVVCGAWDLKATDKVIAAFTSATFRVYPNADIRGVAIGGALKNIIAIACGIADGLGLGMGARASLVTRGLHEMVKLSVADGCQPQTLYGLSGLGDLYLTCSSPLSRNFRFGQLLSTGLTRASAEKQIGMVVEGAYTCRAAKDMAEKLQVSMPITDLVWHIMEGNLLPGEAVERLMQRLVKEEHL